MNEELKQKYHNTEREINTFVRIYYDVGLTLLSDVDIVSPTTHPISSLSNLIGTEFIRHNEGNFYNYASFETDFFKLDGSLRVPLNLSERQMNAGFISNYPTKRMPSNPTLDSRRKLNIEITFIQEAGINDSKIPGITMYFKGSIPTNGTAYFTEITDEGIEVPREIEFENGKYEYDETIDEWNTIEEPKERIYIDFGGRVRIKDTIRIYIEDWEKIGLRIRINNIDIGCTDYLESKKSQILDLDVSNTSRHLCTEIPDDECNITIADSDRKFNIMNPRGITNILSKSTRIEPKIGITDEYGEVDYTTMGLYYLEKFEHNEDDTATLNFKGSTFLLKDIELNMYSNNDSYFFTSLMPLNNRIHFIYDLNYIFKKKILNGDNWFGVLSPEMTKDVLSISADTYEIKDSNLLEILQEFAILTSTIVKMDKDNGQLIIKEPENKFNPNIVDIITKRDLINEPKIEKVGKFNKVNIESIKRGTPSQVLNYNQSMTITESEANKIIKVVFDSPTFIDGDTFLRLTTGSQFELLKNVNGEYMENKHIMFLRSKVSNASEILNFSNEVSDETIKREFDYSEQNEPENILEIKTNYCYNMDYTNMEIIAWLYYFYINEEFKVSAEFIGNPEYNVGDIVQMETKYGIINVYIEKLTHKFDGGLTCNLEGVIV